RDLSPPSVTPKVRERLVDTKLPAAQRARLVDVLATSDDRDAGKALLRSLQTDTPPEVFGKVLENLRLFLPGKWSNLRNGTELNEAVGRLLTKAETKPAALALIAAAD